MCDAGCVPSKCGQSAGWCTAALGPEPSLPVITTPQGVSNRSVPETVLGDLGTNTAGHKSENFSTTKETILFVSKCAFCADTAATQPVVAQGAGRWKRAQDWVPAASPVAARPTPGSIWIKAERAPVWPPAQVTGVLLAEGPTSQNASAACSPAAPTSRVKAPPAAKTHRSRIHGHTFLLNQRWRQ